jgi:RNA polymerase sigma-70 factor (ECF subfamily)
MAVDPDPGQLFEHATAGDRSALDGLLERYLPQLHAFVRARMGAALRPRESSVDVVQSVCRQLLGARDVFEFRGEERFRAWLFTSALNKVREKHRLHHGGKRDQRREARATEGDPIAAVALLLTPSKVAMGNEVAAALSAALEALSEEHREVITLARLAELPTAIIAETMDRSEAAVRKLLGRALLALAAELRRRGVAVQARPATEPPGPRP